jgi:tetratricopeptide (TPR) repeat protein
MQTRGWMASAGVLCLTLAMGADAGHMRRGQEAFRRGDWAQAEKSFAAAVRESPRNAAAMKWLGMVYAAQEKFALAEPHFRRACELNPREELACYYLGRADYALSRFEQSLAAFETALRYDPKSDRVKVGLGLTLEGLGRIEEAERYLKEAAGGRDPRILADYGEFLVRQGRMQEAIAVLKESGDADALAKAMRGLSASGIRSPAPVTITPVQFSASILPMQVKNGATGAMHQIETMIAGVAVFDYDGDGWPDIYVANGATSPGLEKSDASFQNRLYRNRRDGAFEDVTEKAGVAGRGYSMGVAVGDYDNDGHPDLFVTGVRENVLYRNRGDGTFEDVTEKAGLKGDGRWAVAAGWFDSDNDGHLDLFVVHYVRWDPVSEPFCGDTQTHRRAYCHPQYYTPLANALYRNRGDGTFEDVSVSSGIAAHPGKGMGVAFADYDLDGRMDVFVANDTTPNFLFHNLGNGRFEEVGVGAGVAYNADGRAVSGMGADFRDFDNDGREDILLTALSNEGFSLFRNLGRGQFADISQAARLTAASLRLSGWSGGVYDLNNDGRKDLFVATGHALTNSEQVTGQEARQSPAVFLNRGDGRFESSFAAERALYRGAAFGDLNLDGKIDIALTRLNEPPLVLTNRTETQAHWLRVGLRGYRSNRDGIGARIHIVTGGGEQWNHVTRSVGYGGSSEPEAHFGLGRSTTVRVLEVAWPSGVRQVLQNVAADRRIEIEEPR